MLEKPPMNIQRLILHIISGTGFGVRLLWPEEATKENLSDREAGYSSLGPPEGHTMSLCDGVSTLLEQLCGCCSLQVAAE